MQLLTNFASFD